MNQKTIGVIGLLITILFISGFLTLFIFNPQTLEEVDNITSIASYNLSGMNGRWLAAYFNYLTIGLLNLVFGVGLFKLSKNDLPVVIGKILILIAGLIWTSFGLMSWDPNSDTGIHTVMIRVITLLLIAPLGLIFLGTEFEKIIKDKFSKYYTLTTGLTILLLGILSVFVFNDQTWIRTNISLTIYFLWFGVIGLRLVQKASAQQNVSSMVR
jgi:hypothetical protein